MATFSKTLLNKQCTIQIDEVAVRSETSVLINFDDNNVLATVCYSVPDVLATDFLPLTVMINDNLFAKQKIPGSYNRRENKPSLDATLSSRIIDRSMRPLFDKLFFGETQLIVNPYNINENDEPVFTCFLAASLTLALSSIPFEHNVAGLRIARIEGEVVLNPTIDQIEKSEASVFVAYSNGKFVMIDGEFNELTNPEVVSLINEALPHLKEIEDFIKEVKSQFGKQKNKPSLTLSKEVENSFNEKKDFFLETLSIQDKDEKEKKLNEALKDLSNQLTKDLEGDELKTRKNEINLHKEDYFSELLASFYSKTKTRFDGRQSTDVRPLTAKIDFIKGNHGCGKFSRGETEVLSILVLGPQDKVLYSDDLWNEANSKDYFYLHYNFPAFSVGETFRIGPPKRRELGHGALAEKAIKKILPDQKLPYTLRVVCDVLSSNGSSSQASICATSLALFDAGIKTKGHVAGVALGLLTKDSETFILSDIEGWEDHYGEMDFKVGQTRKGVCSIQLDLKNSGIDIDVIKRTLDQANTANNKILDVMYEATDTPRKYFKDNVLKCFSLDIPQDKVGAIIGPGGKTIKKLLADHEGLEMNIDEATANIYHKDPSVIEEVVKKVKALAGMVEYNVMVNAPVARIETYGLFVDIDGVWGLVHYSKLPKDKQRNLEDHYKIGDKIKVTPTGKDSQGRLQVKVS